LASGPNAMRSSRSSVIHRTGLPVFFLSCIMCLLGRFNEFVFRNGHQIYLRDMLISKTMNKTIARFGGVSLAVLGVTLASAAHAQSAFGTTTAATSINDLTSAVAVIIGAVIGAILTLLAGLMGLGWGKRKVQGHITGRKF